MLTLEEIAELELRAKEATPGPWHVEQEPAEEYYGNFCRVDARTKLVALLPDYGPEDRANLALLLRANDIMQTLRAVSDLVIALTELEEANFFMDFSDPAHPRCICGGEGELHDADCIVGMARRIAGRGTGSFRSPARQT